MRVTLASASPRRRELIKKIPSLEVTIVVSNADESSVVESDPTKLVKALALLKASEVSKRVGGIVIGADTVVAVDGKILGKPKSADEARSFFRLLCGRSHEVITGVAVVYETETLVRAEKSVVTFNPYDESVVEAYIASGKPFDKAGGYGVQDELLSPLIASVEGDLDNVIGLPVELLRRTIEEKIR